MTRILDFKGDLSTRDLAALSKLNLRLQDQHLEGKPRPATSFKDYMARLNCDDGGMTCIGIQLCVFQGALSINSVGFARPDGRTRGCYVGSCMPSGLLRQAVALILHDRADEAALGTALFPEVFA